MSKVFRDPIRRGVQHWFDIPVFFGFDERERLAEHFAGNKPFIFVDHAYFSRGYERGNFRVVRSDIHQRVLKDVSKPRFGKTACAGWKSGNHILVFPPSYSIAKTFDTKAWTHETVAELKKHTDRRVIVKAKDDPKPLKHFLKGCHAAVGFGTVASVEAAMAGIPVFCGPRCPATPIGLTDLSLIESPIYPDREAWINTLTWSQFHFSEIQSGLVKEVLNGIG